MNPEILAICNQLTDAYKKEGRKLVGIEFTTIEINATSPEYSEMESCGFFSN